MNGHIEVIDQMTDTMVAREGARKAANDFGPLVLFQGQSITFVSFGLLVGIGAIMGLIHTWFYLGAYQIIANTQQSNQLALTLALGVPVSAYLLTRLLDIGSLLSGEKTFMEFMRTVSFGLWGGLVGGLFILTIFSFMTATPLFALLDAFAVGIPLAQVFGRLGCLNYGCCHGKECSTNTRFGIQYQNPQSKVLRYDSGLKGKHLYPTQIYSVLANMLIYSVLLSLALFWDTRPVGLLAAVYMGLYGLKRFSVEYLRGEFPRVYFWGLTVWQWFSLSFILQGAVILGIVLSRGNAMGELNLAAGMEGLFSAIGVLIFTSNILGLAYGTHGRKIGSW